MQIKNVLIIGGCGYIGSRLAPRIQNDGHTVTTIDLEWFGNYNLLNNNKIDFSTLTKDELAIYDVVILLAGHSSVPMSLGIDGSTFRNNVNNFVNLTDKLNKNQIFIYASSSSVYNNFGDDIIDETYSGYQPTNSYDLSKLTIDYYMLNRKDLNYYGLRFGTVNGFSTNFRADVMINAMWKTYKEIGNIIISNKKINRPILAINDLTNAISTIIFNASHDKSGIYNLHSFNATVEEIAIAVSNKLQCGIEDKGNTGKAYNFKMNCEKINEVFSFKSTATIEDIVNDIVSKENNINKTDRNKIKYYV